MLSLGIFIIKIIVSSTEGKNINFSLKRLKHACLLDSDEIAEFLKDKYPDLYDKDFVKNSNELVYGYYLK